MSISFKNVRHYILCNLGECYGRKAKKRVDKKCFRFGKKQSAVLVRKY